MPIEVRELHIRVVVQDTSEATLASPGGLAVEGDTSRHPDHDGWIEINSVSIGVHRPSGGAEGDDMPTEEVSFAHAQVKVQHAEGGGYQFQADANAPLDGGIWMGAGRDLLLGGAGADDIDAASDGADKGELGTCQPETIHDELPLSTADAEGIPLGTAEYALFL